MYTHYCKDTNCPGHTKSWERCCDMRAFGQHKTTIKPFQPSRPTATDMPFPAKVRNTAFA